MAGRRKAINHSLKPPTRTVTASRQRLVGIAAQKSINHDAESHAECCIHLPETPQSTPNTIHKRTRKMKPETPSRLLTEQIERAIKMLPEKLTQNQVEALLMTIAQGYAPDHETAAVVLVNAGITLKDLADDIEEARTTTLN
jgi:hypothetical protein